MRFFVIGFACTMAMTFAQGARGQDTQSTSQPTDTNKLSVGDTAPDFTATYPAAQGGAEDQHLALSEYKGKKNVLLAFYPKADTPGCTTQMCGYRDDWSMFEDMNTAVISISADKQTASDKFQKKYNLPMIVLGNPEREIIKAYGVPLKEGSGNAQRSVVLIDKQGIVRYVNYNYKIKEDKDALYEAIKNLQDKE